ncbi:MAG: class I SAM-dependent methyltransferase [Acidimicrobiales bacterium]
MDTKTHPLDYSDLVDGHARGADTMLDLGTGGGEWLASLPHRPQVTVATESWHPNVAIARDRLAPIGIDVVEVEGCLDNDDQGPEGAEGPRLPFGDHVFELVTARHEAFVAREVARIVAGGGHFATEQVGVDGHREFRELFGVPVHSTDLSFLDLVTRQAEHAGMRVDEVAEATQQSTFHDVGALAWFLRMVPWAVPDFSIERYRGRLELLHREMSIHGPLTVGLLGLYFVATDS